MSDITIQLKQWVARVKKSLYLAYFKFDLIIQGVTRQLKQWASYPGRPQKDLTQKQIELYEKVNKDLLIEYGFTKELLMSDCSDKSINPVSDDIKFVAGGGYFSYQYLLGFLEFLASNRDVIEIITYDDLPWGSDKDCSNYYPDEYKTWTSQLKNKPLGRNKIYVLLQHDVDRLPERTMRVLEDESRLGVPSNTMIFNRHVNRKHIRETGEMMFAEYDIDFKRLRELQNQDDFVFCYHCNAYEQALFDMGKAQTIFDQDVSDLRENLQIKYFSPHGGARCPAGESNSSQDWVTEGELRWVHNGRGVRFHGNYSDGGLNNRSRDPNQRDLRDFVTTWKMGKRYRVLLHPQYYHSPFSPSEWLFTAQWYRRMVEQCASGQEAMIWQDVKLAV